METLEDVSHLTESQKRAKLSGSAVSKVDLEYCESPGSELQWTVHPWNWHMQVTSVSEGHKAVKDKDKAEASLIGAKLTFGEVLDCGVSKILHDMGASSRNSLHDLGMGTAKLLIQAFLQYPNLNRCFGVELAIGRYKLAEKNLLRLVDRGFGPLEFMVASYTQNSMSIIQTVRNAGNVSNLTQTVSSKVTCSDEGIRPWMAGDTCYVFMRDLVDYDTVTQEVDASEPLNSRLLEACEATVLDVSRDGLSCDVQFRENGSYLKSVSTQRVFLKSEIRVLAIECASLFDGKDNFKADINILETDFPSAMHSSLIERMAHTSRVGCRFLTYHDLKELSDFEWDHLRQVDCNVFDNNRFCTSWSQGWRFYLWENIHPKHLSFDRSHQHCLSENELSRLTRGTPLILRVITEGNNTTNVLFSDDMRNDNDDDETTINMRNNENHNPLAPRLLRRSVNAMNVDDPSMSRSSNHDILRYGEFVRISRSNNNGKSHTKKKQHQNSGDWRIHIVTSLVKEINDDVMHHEFREEAILLANVQVFLANHRHRLAQKIAAFFPEQVSDETHENRFELARATVISIDPRSLSYTLRYDDYSEEYRKEVDERYVFTAPSMECVIGDELEACWPRNAQNKNCSERYRRFPATVVGINADATYQVQYQIPSDVAESSSSAQLTGGPRAGLCIAKYVREMWVKPLDYTVDPCYQPTSSSSLSSSCAISAVSNNNNNMSRGVGNQRQPLRGDFMDIHPGFDAHRWSVKIVCQWLRWLNLDRLVPVFEIGRMDGATLVNIFEVSLTKALRKSEKLSDRKFAELLMSVAEKRVRIMGPLISQHQQQQQQQQQQNQHLNVQNDGSNKTAMICDEVSTGSSSGSEENSSDQKCPSPGIKSFKLNFLERRNLFSGVQYLHTVVSSTGEFEMDSIYFGGSNNPKSTSSEKKKNKNDNKMNKKQSRNRTKKRRSSSAENSKINRVSFEKDESGYYPTPVHKYKTRLQTRRYQSRRNMNDNSNHHNQHEHQPMDITQD